MVSWTPLSLLLVVLAVLIDVHYVSGHGGMLEPPMRSLAWKYGFDAPVNYNWMALYCGGLNVFTQNNGKCGLCGDPYNGPFENDKGGVYDTGIIVRHYPIGLREIEVKIEITAHHKGFITFKLCPNNAQELTQDCLDRYPLLVREGRLQGDPTRYFPPKNPKLHELHVLLPQGIMCDRCVLQWTYTAGNNIGRAIQETFVNCADISIGGTLDNIPVTHIPNNHSPVLVINSRANITAIIDQASPDSVTDVLAALAADTNSMASPDGFTWPGNSLTNSDKTGVNGELSPPFGHELQVVTGPEFRDPRMRIPSLNEFIPRSSAQWPNVADSPGHTRNSVSDMNSPLPSDIPIEWHQRTNTFGQGQYIPLSQIYQGQGETGSSHVPTPSQVSLAATHSDMQHSMNNMEGILTDRGTHATLFGSVASVARQIGPAHTMASQFDTAPSGQFVQQMTDIRRTFPERNQWRRGDGVSSAGHAVRHVPRLDTHDFSPAHIREYVPSLPSDIGPRQDFAPHMDPRIYPEMLGYRNNWFPRSRYIMQRQRMRMADNSPRTITLLPRRIEVQSMGVAQHLLRKYPQLKGRVYLSRQAHIRNQYSHMIHKYARRQNWN